MARLHGTGGALALPVLLLLAGCGSDDNDPGPGGVTVGEARALDEAAEMLDEQRLPPEALPDKGEATPDAAETHWKIKERRGITPIIFARAAPIRSSRST